MSGIVGLLAFSDTWNVVKFTYYGLIALQNRGRGVAGLALVNDDLQQIIGTKGEASELEVEGARGWASIGYVGRDRKYPLQLGSQVIVVDGIASDDELIRALEDPTQPLKFSFISLTKNGTLTVRRDSFGLKPLYLGSFGFDVVMVASEPSAIWAVGGELRRELDPGELLVIDRMGLSMRPSKREKRRTCSLEYIYMSRLDSVLSDVPIYQARVKLGELLAKDYPINADVVVGVPETGIPVAIGYSRASGISFELGFVKMGSYVRTMGIDDPFMRLVGAQLKLNPIKSVFDDRRVILIDDSMVTGNTLRNTVQVVRRAGAKEVHVLLASPKLVRSCPYGVDVPDSRFLVNEGDVYKRIGADSLRWITIESMYRALGTRELCTLCMGGQGLGDEK
ncbi:amidophosphoribosyltransferase [Sulfodiicoccus acidiphilus]|uniref:Amidophosphoribosyltransferase n=1 Tax=Sulfodiicoccus acidiphilus TaxID=1670455 RepID=A0A348B0N9_9CREN|nr:phosphoribosyltransferase family protein [Sulfodiicoccus acidiphilus]BBD71741.1 amidophosphoribosyltransferase [Sulfodiicoccus acidiphilus]GGT86213.1 amidophosphoribosyltransferase [Sulfodiicoccus acidiphilus]